MAGRFLSVLLIFALFGWGQETENKRYIVVLEGTPAVRAKDRGAARAALDGEQGRLREAMQGLRMSEVASLKTAANALIVEGAPGMEAALSSLPGVKRVVPDRELKLFLDAALDVHSVKTAWERVGGLQNAGAGVRIGIFDTGIYAAHPAFQAPEEFPVPEGFPRTTNELDLDDVRASRKIIVARAYDAGGSVFDWYGHGTAVAAAAAAYPHESPRGAFSGVAPHAWIGAYKVSRGTSGGIVLSFVLQALEDAVLDGMQVLNMSFGAAGTAGSSQDLLAEAFANLVDAGIVIVAAAGNDGPDRMVVDDSASHPKVIAVGANVNSRAVSPLLTFNEESGLGAFESDSSSNAEVLPTVTAEVIDIAQFDETRLGCQAYGEGALEGKVALISRGICTFSEKLLNAQMAGAVGAIVYNNVPIMQFSMLVEDPNVRIGGHSITLEEGETIRQTLQTGPLTATLRYFRTIDPNRLTDFSSRGPAVEFTIKPDLLAVGSSFYTAGASLEGTQGVCTICGGTGYDTTSGTSFSSPLVAGAAAVVRGLRPEATATDIQSLIVNSAEPLFVDDQPAPVQTSGAGKLNLENAVGATLAARPVSLSFGVGGSTVEASQLLHMKNVGSDYTEWRLSVESARETRASISADTMALGAGETGTIEVFLAAGGLEPGAYEGFVVAQRVRPEGEDPQPGDRIRIPYWYGIRSTEAASISILDADTRRILFRVFDREGIPILDPLPEVTTETPGVTIGEIREAEGAPGTLRVELSGVPFFGALVQIRMGETSLSVRVE